MSRFKVNLDWSGYSRGTSTWIVEAKDKEEAEECFFDGKRISHMTMRDDTDREVSSVELVPDHADIR